MSYTPGDPGSVLYEAVGDVDLMVVAVNSGDQTAVYAGPLMSWYEFTRPFGNRLTDNEWQSWVVHPADAPRRRRVP